MGRVIRNQRKGRGSIFSECDRYPRVFFLSISRGRDGETQKEKGNRKREWLNVWMNGLKSVEKKTKEQKKKLQKC